MLFQDHHYGITPYPDPFISDVASTFVPSDWNSVLRWCEHIFQGTYAMACDRIVSYFLTDLQFDKIDQESVKKWEALLNDTLNIMPTLKAVLLDRSCYGNGFVSVLAPFNRWLSCPTSKCGYGAPLKVMYNAPVFKLKWQIPHFHATCPNCKKRSKFIIDDRPKDTETDLIIKRWSPKQIEITEDEWTGQTKYIWRIPEDYKRKIKMSNATLFDLERVPQSVIEAIHKNYLYEFEPDTVFHMKEMTLAGRINRGWGWPRLFQNFKQIFHIQVLRRQNEAIALDYITPWRVISPESSGAPTDPLHSFNGDDFRREITRMARRRRRDPGSVSVSAFPLNYQIFGAEGKQLAPVELIDAAVSQLLNDMGVPIELYQGSIQLQAAPVALRLLESTFRTLVSDANQFLQWLMRQLTQITRWETVKVSLKRVTVADNIEKQTMAAQLMMANKLSGTTFFRDVGYDWKTENENLADEALEQADIQARAQEKMDTMAFGQQLAKGQLGQQQGAPGAAPAPPGGGGGGGAPQQQVDPNTGQPVAVGPVTAYLQSVGPNVKQTPEDMEAQAQSLADQLSTLDETTKDSELRKLKQNNPQMHAFVQMIRDNQKQQARTQAAQQAGV